MQPGNAEESLEFSRLRLSPAAKKPDIVSEGVTLSPARLRTDMSSEGYPMDHLADVKKFAKKPVNEAAFAGMSKAYALVMSKPDTRYVACSDPAELDRVRENFLKKKLGLKSADLDASIKATCDHMKVDKTKSRLTFYYLLAEHYGKLDAFVK